MVETMIDVLKEYNYWGNEEINIGYHRKDYIDILASHLNNSLIKVILGQRRVGKSYLLRMLIKYLIEKKSVPGKNILYINKDIIALDFINSSQVLQKVILEYQNKLKPRGKIYIFLDEVQEIQNWEKIVNSLSQDYTKKYEIFISGSNANLLSTELSTYLSGRYVSITVFPFAYNEFLGYKKLVKNKDTFLEYLKDGGLPETLHLDEMEIKKNYIASLKDSIILRDIVLRHKVRDVYLLKKLMNFIIDSVGSLFSVNKVVKYLNSSGYKTNNETIGNYLMYLKESYLIYEAEMYDIKGKHILHSEKKYFINDLSYKYFLASSFDLCIGNYLENVIFMHLKRLGYQVYVGKIRDKEIDFIAEKNAVKKYIQAAYLLSDKSVVEREFGNLEMIHDSYEKIVVSLDDINLGNRNGIKHIQAWEFIT